jgi:hypothetical protein
MNVNDVDYKIQQFQMAHEKVAVVVAATIVPASLFGIPVCRHTFPPQKIGLSPLDIPPPKHLSISCK